MTKNILNIINEEISNFDFLGNDEHQKELDSYNILQNEDFQKQFICDSLVNKEKIKQHITDARIGGNWNELDDASNLSIEYFVDIDYAYDPNKKPAKLTLNFSSDKISISINSKNDQGSYDVEPSGDAVYTNINWRDIDVIMTTPRGDEIDFIAFKKAPDKIKVLFIREFVEKFIDNETINTDYLKKDKIGNIPYC